MSSNTTHTALNTHQLNISKQKMQDDDISGEMRTGVQDDDRRGSDDASPNASALKTAKGIYCLPPEVAARNIFTPYLSPRERQNLLFSISPEFTQHFRLDDHYCKKHGQTYDVSSLSVAGDDHIESGSKSPYDGVREWSLTNGPRMTDQCNESEDGPLDVGKKSRSKTLEQIQSKGKDPNVFLSKLDKRVEPFPVHLWEVAIINQPETPLGDDADFGTDFRNMRKCFECECEARRRYNAKRGFVRCGHGSSTSCGQYIPITETTSCYHCATDYCVVCTVKKLHRCQVCNEFKCNGCIEIYTCNDCRSRVCHDCAVGGNFRQCEDCLSSFCLDCSKQCGECYGSVCDSCVKQCNSCGLSFCSDHYVTCGDCQLTFCMGCSKECHECCEEVCVECADDIHSFKKSDCCGSWFCSDHYVKCRNCYNVLCLCCAPSMDGYCLDCQKYAQYS